MGYILVQNNEKILEQANLELQVNSGENLAPRCSLILELKKSVCLSPGQIYRETFCLKQTKKEEAKAEFKHTDT